MDISIDHNSRRKVLFAKKLNRTVHVSHIGELGRQRSYWRRRGICSAPCVLRQYTVGVFKKSKCWIQNQPPSFSHYMACQESPKKISALQTNQNNLRRLPLFSIGDGKGKYLHIYIMVYYQNNKVRHLYSQTNNRLLSPLVQLLQSLFFILFTIKHLIALVLLALIQKSCQVSNGRILKCFGSSLNLG